MTQPNNSLSVANIATHVTVQFGDESNIQIQTADIMRWINDAQRDLCLNNNLLQARAVANVVLGQMEYTLPTDMLTIRSIRYEGQKLMAMSAQEAEEFIDNTSVTGQPNKFWVWAQRLNIYPAPDKSLVSGLQIYYSRQPAVVTLTTDVPELPMQYHNRILEYCMKMAYELDENWPAAQAKAQQFQEGVRELKGNVDWVERDFYPSITSLPSDYY